MQYWLGCLWFFSFICQSYRESNSNGMEAAIFSECDLKFSTEQYFVCWLQSHSSLFVLRCTVMPWSLSHLIIAGVCHPTVFSFFLRWRTWYCRYAHLQFLFWVWHGLCNRAVHQSSSKHQTLHSPIIHKHLVSFPLYFVLILLQTSLVVWFLEEILIRCFFR